ncbi:hypothetical protein PIB30_048688 [Stylosanthes scabra]|uniref:Uncharacterized protein n=1 Tax=Stylosanthes scabra TaxID=79078 RepID=A0ABU6RHH0_9FABA|nr:hypothetical protein [Stylosanthes scabra]
MISPLPFPDDQIGHFTDMMRLLYLPPTHHHRHRQPSRKTIKLLVHRASELDEVGIKFRSRYGSNSPLALEYEYGVLTMPRISLSEDWSEIVLRNILALEHCNHPTQHYVFDYVDFVSQLINTDKDVDILVDNEIINHLYHSALHLMPPGLLAELKQRSAAGCCSGTGVYQVNQCR